MPCYTHKQIQDFLRNAGFPDIRINSKSGSVPLLALMSAISTQESGRCDEPVGILATGREISIGIMQINSMVHKKYTVAQLKNPNINAQEAYRIYKAQGLNARGGYLDNKYKKYLNDALKAYGETPTVITNNTVNNTIQQNNQTTGQNIPFIADLEKTTGLGKNELIIGGVILLMLLL